MYKFIHFCLIGKTLMFEYVSVLGESMTSVKKIGIKNKAKVKKCKQLKYCSV